MRRLRMAVALAAIAFTCLASSAQAVVTIGMPFSGKWAYNTHVNPPYSDSNSSHPSAHWAPGGGDWSTDLYAAAGTEVRLRVRGDGPISFGWIGSSGCGGSTRLSVMEYGRQVGTLYIAHISGAVTSGAITNGMLLGKVGNFSCNPGPHIHVEFKNTIGAYSCYVNNGNPGVTLGDGAPLGVLGSPNNGPKQACASAPPVVTPPPPPYVQPPTLGFNGDPFSDVGILHKLGDGGMDIHVLYGNDPPFTFPTTFTRQLAASSGWSWNKVKTASGYFNSDRYEDIVLVHEIGDGGADVHVVYGNDPPFTYPTTHTRRLSGANGWSWKDMKVVAGKFNGDAFSDVGILHRLGDGGIDVHVLYGNDPPFTYPTTMTRRLPASSGWSWDKIKPAAGYFNGDRFEDIALVQEIADGGADAHVLYGGDPPFTFPTTYTRKLAGSSGWKWADMKVTSGKFNGDSMSDLGIIHRLGDGGMDAHVLYGNDPPFTYPNTMTRRLPASSGWSWDNVKTASGFFNGDKYEDIVLLHKLGDGGADAHVLYGNDPPFTFPTTLTRRLAAANGWRWDDMKIVGMR